jgi:hypothetical protein
MCKVSLVFQVPHTEQSLRSLGGLWHVLHEVTTSFSFFC